MSAESWIVGLNGNWFTASNWSGGSVPDLTTDVTIDAVGTYTVALSAGEIANANSITLNSPGATFSEAATASLITNGTFDVEAGTAILRGSNAISGGVSIGAQGLVEIANDDALGGLPLLVEGNGELLALTDLTVANQLGLGFAVLAAAKGRTLTLSNGDWLPVGSAQILIGEGVHSGTVVWDTKSTTVKDFGEVAVEAGTLKGGDGNFGVFLGGANFVFVNKGAVLDLAGADATIQTLLSTSSGTVTSSSGAPVLTLETIQSEPTMTVVFAGSLSLDIADSMTFVGANTYSGTTEIEAAAEVIVGNGGAAGSLGQGLIHVDGILTFNLSGTHTISNAFSGDGLVDFVGGTFIVNTPTAFTGTTVLFVGVYETNTASVGATLEMDFAEFLATKSLTISSALDLTAGGIPTLAAAHGQTLTLALSDHWTIDRTALKIGDGVADGTVLWEGGTGGTFVSPGTDSLEIVSGRFKDGDNSLDTLLHGVNAVTIDAGATLELTNPAELVLNLLQGGGTLLSDVAKTIVLNAADFSGTFAGPIGLVIEAPSVLTGDSAGVKAVDLDLGGVLALGNGGTTGSLGHATITFDGVGSTLVIDHSDDFALVNKLTGDGILQLRGGGTTTINHVNAFNGTVDIVASELSINHAAAIGDTLRFEGGKFLSTENMALNLGSLDFLSGNVTIAAATGKFLTLNPSQWSFDAHSLQFGDTGETGTIVWHTAPGGSGVDPSDHYTVEIDGATLRAADGNLGELLFPADSVTVFSGATLDFRNFGGSIGNLLGKGIVTGSAGTVDIADGNFAGQIQGHITVDVSGDLLVSGNNTFTGGYHLDNGATLTLGAAASQDVTFLSKATLAFTLGHEYDGTVFNFDFTVGQTMDFGGIDFATATDHFAHHVLTISDGTHSEAVHLAGTFTDASFALSDDLHGGVDVNFTGTTVSGDPTGLG